MSENKNWREIKRCKDCNSFPLFIPKGKEIACKCSGCGKEAKNGKEWNKINSKTKDKE